MLAGLVRAALIGLLLAASSASAQVAPADPFLVLRQAYADHDAAAAAGAYSANAVVVYAYEGVPEERHVGRRAIEQSFAAFFNQFRADSLDLNFRFAHRDARGASGIYRLRIGDYVSYGGFDVTFDGALFSRDVSTTADIEDFEMLPGPVLANADDEELDRGFYSWLVGRYRTEQGCDLVVTRSVVRLFVRDTCTQEWRGLTRVSGHEWTAGDRVRSDAVSATYRFTEAGDGASAWVDVTSGGATQRATRRMPYRTEGVSFRSFDGETLTGTLYIPLNAPAQVPASVMLHGSGPQDRDGYASIIAVMSDEMAANGRMVLAYDKRGSGGSSGDGARAGFDTLARDAMAAMQFLRQRSDVRSVGMAGSSQAGWIAATAVSLGAQPTDVFLLGAAGAALSVEEQNLYNTEVQMRCQGIARRDIRLALDQQRAFFENLRNPASAARLDALTARARQRPALADWLFPDSANTDRSAGAWYVVLDPDFDPLPIWRAYTGRAHFVFSENDDATPTAQAIRRLRGSSVQTSVLSGAQHLGLQASDVCRASLTDTSAFSPELFRQIAAFASAR
jgi:alpha/beta superfamily hydrolase